MERIIKFRAWDESRIEMIYQFGTLGNNEPQLISDDEDDRLFCGHYKPNGDWIQPILMQFTGLYDKNGKEIYEGDILEWRRYRFEVRFNNGEYYGYPFSNNEIPGNLSCGHFYESEIIGNVFQNSELLND